MHGYVVSRPVVLRTAMQVKHIPASADLNKVDVALVQINAFAEHKLVREALARHCPDVPVESLMKTVPFERLAMWDKFPVLLGRRGKGVSRAGDVLRGQVLALKARHPRRERFRILINNGFGTNLGDTLIGLTAFRSAWSLLTELLPEVSVDVLTGWTPINGVTDLLRQHQGIEQVLHQGPSMQEMARYQGLFDFGDLIVLPGYGKMAPVDWYLWWLGLDPAQVAEGEKRNRVALAPADSEAVARSLSACAGPKILINPKASELLRRMPDSTLQSLVAVILESDPAISVVFDQPVTFEHPRAIHLADVINTPQRLTALVAQVDGIITPDTFVQHVADATGTPTCTLSASVPASFFRYYPMVQTLVLPGAEGLDGWGKTKVKADQWEELAPAYAQAWARLDSAVVMDALRLATSVRRAMPDALAIRIDNPAKPFGQLLVAPKTSAGSGLKPTGQLADTTSDGLERQLLNLGAQILLPGDTVALLGAGAGDLACSLAKLIGPNGRLIVCEPRRMVHQVVCANVLLAGLDHVETHPVMPTGSGFSIRSLPGLALQDDHVAIAESNRPVSEPVVHWPLDRLALPRCRLLVIQSPVPLLKALHGAAETVARHRPFVVAGLLRSNELESWRSILRDEDYAVRAFPLRQIDAALRSETPEEKEDALVLVAEPRRKATEGEKR